MRSRIWRFAVASSNVASKNWIICAQLQSTHKPSQNTCLNYVHNPQNCFGKFTFCATFGAHKLVHSKPFLDYLYEFWQLLSALYITSCGKFLYRCTSTFSTLKYCSGIFFKSLSYLYEVVHNLFRRFSDLSQFLTAISQTLWCYLVTKMRTM